MCTMYIILTHSTYMYTLHDCNKHPHKTQGTSSLGMDIHHIQYVQCHPFNIPMVNRPNHLLCNNFLAQIHQYGESIRVLCQLPNPPSARVFCPISTFGTR